VIRSVLVAILLVAVLIIGIAHGTRGLVVAGVIILAWSAKDSRAWKAAEAFLVRLTGSRRRAAVLVMAVVIVVVLVFDVYQASR
jgi:nicotinamide riboside transporter PnuC